MNAYKNDFPIFEHNAQLVYLDTAATAQKPKQVLDAMYAFDAESYGTVHRAVYDLAHTASAKYNEAREKVQNFLSARHTNEIIFTKGTTESINLLAYAYPLAFMKPGDELLLTEAEHHSNLVPWQIAKEKHGIEIKYVPLLDSGDLDLEALKTLLGPKTRLLSLAHVSNTLGIEHPIKEIIKLAHANGTHVFLDAAQSAPHIELNVQDLDVDFLTFSGHKLYGPTGIGILYGKEELLEKLSPYQTGGSMVGEVTLESASYAKLPLKFEAGTPMITQSIGLAAAIDYINAISIKRIHAHEQSLYQAAKKALSEIEGLHFLGSPKDSGSLISFTVDNVHSLDIATMLNLKHIAVRTGDQCSQNTMRRFHTSHVTRISFGIYNTLEDISYFTEQLRSVIEKLR